MIRSKMNALLCPQHYRHYKSMKESNSKVNSPIWLEIKLIRDFISVLITCKFHKAWIKHEGANMSTTFFSSPQGGVTLKLIEECGWNSNSSKILWLSWLTLSLMMIWSNMKAILCPQHFLHYKSTGNFFRHSRASSSKAIVRSGLNLNSSKILCVSWLIGNNSKFEKYPIKNDAIASITTFPALQEV